MRSVLKSVPKNQLPKKQLWRGLQELGSGRIRFLGTVQYFRHLKGLKCCIAPKEPIPEAQNAVLSLKTQQINYGEVFKGLALHELVFLAFFGTVHHSL